MRVPLPREQKPQHFIFHVLTKVLRGFDQRSRKRVTQAGRRRRGVIRVHERHVAVVQDNACEL